MLETVANLSVWVLILGAVVGAFVINIFGDHWDFGDYFGASILTSIVGSLLAVGLWFAANKVVEADPALTTSPPAVEEASVEEEPPSERAPKPQYDFGLGKFE